MKSFFTNVADAINIARLNHFKSLNLTKKSDRVIEVGCGPVGFFTKYLEKNVKEVISVDARQNLIEEHVKRHPHRRNKVGIANLNEKDSLKKIGKFDLCFCYGLLYHLSNPAQAIENIASTSQMVVISTICSPVDNGEVNFTKEDKDNDNQSYDGDACRPARDWIMKELKKHYQFVYCIKTQPKHIEFPLKWPIKSKNANSGINFNTRAIFVGSTKSLESNKLLSKGLLNKYTTGNKLVDFYLNLKRWIM